jgi:Type I phosphodiesterase / nucleotide pyrophosphatase
MKRVILLLVDGLRADVAETALARGNLPHLAAMVGAHGAARGITVFPSTTTVAYLPFLTGCTPGTCNVPSIRWLDRTRYTGRWWAERHLVRSYCGHQADCIDGDIAPGLRTIFELVPESLGIFTPVAKGLTPTRNPSRLERKLWGSLAHLAQWHQPSDDSVARHLLAGVDAGWRFIFAQFPAVDGYTHQSTPDGAKVLRALERVDETVGLLRHRLAERGESDDALVLLVSDHGASVVHSHLDLAGWFREQGVPTLSHPALWERHPRAAVMIAGNGSGMVYAHPEVPRRERWSLEQLRTPEAFGTTHDVVAAMLRESAVALVAAEAASGTITVAGRAKGRVAEADIQRERSGLRYLPRDGDPLGIGGERCLTEEDWLAATWDTAWPDAVVQLYDQFRAERTGDLVVVAQEGYDLRRRFEIPEHKAGHGSLVRAHMQVPIWSSVPGPGGPIRTVDLFPAMLEWLGEEVPDGIDGQAVWSPARTPVA